MREPIGVGMRAVLAMGLVAGLFGAEAVPASALAFANSAGGLPGGGSQSLGFSVETFTVNNPALFSQLYLVSPPGYFDVILDNVTYGTYAAIDGANHALEYDSSQSGPSGNSYTMVWTGGSQYYTSIGQTVQATRITEVFTSAANVPFVTVPNGTAGHGLQVGMPAYEGIDWLASGFGNATVTVTRTFEYMLNNVWVPGGIPGYDGRPETQNNSIGWSSTFSYELLGNPTPEPASLALLGLGVVSTAVRARRRA